MKKLICITLLFVSVFGSAQNENGLWKKNNSSREMINEEKSNFPQKDIFNLDLTSLKNVLKGAPKRDVSSKHSNTVITLPTVDGKMEKFKVYQNAIMAPELAAKYPEIKSYIAVGVDNTNTRAYLSCSPLGFKSMIVYPNKETVFIEPISADKLNYTVYKSSDKKRAFNKFDCNADHDVMDFTNEIIDNSTILMRGADDAKLRTYRFAVSCTGEYAAYFGGTKALALAGIVNTMTRVNGIFERDFGVRLVLVVNNDAVIYTDATLDPYTTVANIHTELNNCLNANIGDANYDLGHLFDSVRGGGSSVCIGCVGISNYKGKAYSSTTLIPEGDQFDINMASHEIAHQLGAKHTFTYVTEASNTAQMEPGSGSTIMSYAGKTVKDIQATYDSYFHAISIQQVTDNLKAKTCGTITNTGDEVPVVNAGLDYTIPKGTPFMLTGSATDANAVDVLTYSWEQMDLGNATTTIPTTTALTGPLFRSYSPTTTSTRYFPTMNTVLAGLTTTAGYRIASETLPSVARTLNFRLTVRDNHVGGAANNTDDVVVTVDGVAGPFTIDTQNTTVSYVAGTTQNVNWTVAGTNANGVNCANVDILLSTDGGVTFPITLVAGTSNDGTQTVVIPNVSGVTNRIMVKGSNHIFFDVNNANFTIIGSGSEDITAPTASVVAASGVTTTGVNLSWTASSDNIGVAGYKVYQNGVLKTTTTTTSLVVSGLTASTTYSFYVTAFDAVGNTSVASNTVNVTTLTPADTTAPIATVVSVSGITTSGANLSWTATSDNVGVAGYKVYQNGVLKTTTTTTSLVVSGLTASTTYSFYVTAYDVAGNISVASNTLNVTTLAPAVTYCNSNGTTVYEFINRVQIGTIDNSSGNNGGYGNFTAMSTNVNVGSLVSISIFPSWTSTSYAEAFNVWIDYNKNGNFDSNELVFSKSKSKVASVSGSFTIPNSALTGTTRMRVSMKYNVNPTACEVFTRGEVEDYTINVVNGSVVKSSNEFSNHENTESDNNIVKDDAILKTNKDEVEELAYKLYPNPVKDGVMYFSGLTNNSGYKIFNQFGQQLAQGTIENDMINVGTLATGIYFVQVTNNSSVGVKRFIKE